MAYSVIINPPSIIGLRFSGVEKRCPGLFCNSPIFVKPSLRLHRDEKQTLCNLPRLHYFNSRQQNLLAFAKPSSSDSEYTEFDKFLYKYRLNYRSCLIFVTALILGFYAGVVLTKRNARIFARQESAPSSMSESVKACSDSDLPDDDESILQSSETYSKPSVKTEMFIWWLQPSFIIIVGGIFIYLSSAFVD